MAAYYEAEHLTGYEVLVSCNEKLVSEIAQDPHKMAGLLFQNHFISGDTNKKVNELNQSKNDKARMLVMELQDKVKCFPEKYDKFIDILKEDPEWSEDLLFALQDCYQRIFMETNSCSSQNMRRGSDFTSCSTLLFENLTEDEQESQGYTISSVRSRSTSSSGVDSTLSVSLNKFVQFSCECGHCTILGYISGEDQCSGSTLPQIKLLTPDSQCPINRVTCTEISYGIFKTALLEETRKVHTRFCKLLQETFSRLKETTELEEVKSFTQSLLIPPGNEMYNSIYTTSCTTIEQLERITDFNQLKKFLQKNYCSWYNYAIISALREEFLHPKKNDEYLHKYESFFAQYVQRRCFLYLEELGPQSRDVKTLTVTCKVDINFTEITHKQIEKFKLLFVKTLSPQLTNYNLTLKCVQEGCTELVFRAPEQFITPRTALVQNRICSDLRDCGFIKITVGDWELLPKVDIPTMQSHANSSINLVSEYMTRLLKGFQDGSDDFETSSLLTSLDEVEVNSVKDKDGMSLLHLACQWDWSRWGAVIKSLVEKHQCSTVLVDENYNTPLHVASQFNNVGAVQYLLSLKSCNPSIKNEFGLTPLDIAHEKQHKDVLMELLSSEKVMVDPASLISVTSDGELMCEQDNTQDLKQSHGLYGRVTVSRNLQSTKSQSNMTEEDLKQSHGLYGRVTVSRNLQSTKSQSNMTEEEVHHSPIPHGADQENLHLDEEMLVGTRVSNPIESTMQEVEQLPQLEIEAVHDQSDHESHAKNDSIMVKRNGEFCSKCCYLHCWETKCSSVRCCKCSRWILPGMNIFGIFIFSLLTVICLVVTVIITLYFPVINSSESTVIAQIKEQSIPLIAMHNTSLVFSNSFTFMEITNDRLSVIPIDFYIGDCAQIQLTRKNINIHDFFVPTSSNQLFEQYLLAGTVLTFRFDLLNLRNSECSASLLVFDSPGKYNSFLKEGTWLESYAEFCIHSKNFSIDITLMKTAYYFFGLYTSNVIKHIHYQITGSIQYYVYFGFALGCSIDSNQKSECDIAASSLGISTNVDVCILGLVPPRMEDKMAFQATVVSNGQNTVLILGILSALTIILFFLTGVLITTYTKFCECYHCNHSDHN